MKFFNNFNRKKSIFIVSVPKSGTIYTWNKLAQLTNFKVPNFAKIKNFSLHCAGQDFNHGIYAYSDVYSTVLRPNVLKKYRFNNVLLAHMGASKNNKIVLELTGFDKITVLLRDPKDALVSWFYHCEKHHNWDYYSKIYFHPKEYYSWNKKKKIDHLIKSYFPLIANLIKSWLYEYNLNSKKINLMRFDELKSHPDQYFKNILNFHQVEQHNNIDFAPKKDAMHFRKGLNKEWKNELTTDQIIQCNAIIGSDFKELFNTIICKKINTKVLLSKKNANSFHRKLSNFIYQYPNSELLYNALIKVCKYKKIKNIIKFEKIIKSIDYDDHGNFYLEKERLDSIKEYLYQ